MIYVETRCTIKIINASLHTRARAIIELHCDISRGHGRYSWSSPYPKLLLVVMAT